VVESLVEDFHPMPYEGTKASVFESTRKNSAIQITWYLRGSINPPPMADPYELDSLFASPTLKEMVFKTSSSDLRSEPIVCHQK
jgi:hypothetical protein